MAYDASKPAHKLLARFRSRGKERALIRPEYRPPLEIIADGVSYVALIASPFLAYIYGWPYGLGAVGAALAVYVLREFFFQDDHAIVRIYGPLGRLRFVFERVFRDKYLQYFNETNVDGRPIPRIVRDYIYQKAHAVSALTAFGTELDNYDGDNTIGARMLHKNFPADRPNVSYGFEIGAHRKNVKPFHVTSSVNISGMSYGSINYKSAEAISLGVKDVAYCNTGEGGYGPHGVAGNDVVFQIGTGKFGVGDAATLPDGRETRRLNRDLLKELVRTHDNIRMLQLKISQGAKPGKGGHLPGSKVTPEIAAVRKVPAGKSVISPAQHAELLAGSPQEVLAKLMDFIDEIRELTELPVGIKMCVGYLPELDMLVEAMKASGKGPDAIQLDGTDGGTGAGDNVFVNYVGYGSCIETVAYLDRKLKSAGIRDQVHLSASGKIFTPAHAAVAFAAGADVIETARGAMLSLGCIQSLKCHTNHCPTGIATNSPWRMRGLNVPEKATRIHHYVTGFHKDMLDLTRALGHCDPRDIRREDLRYLGDHHFSAGRDGVELPAPEWA